MKSIRDKVAIVGMGCTKFGEHWALGANDMIVEAAYEAYEDAGISPKDIEAAWVGTAGSGSSGTTLAEPLKFRNIPITRVENYCATGLEALRNACFGVASGLYDIALALGFEKLKDTGGGGLGVGRGLHPVYETRRTAPGSFAFIATRYFETYGIDKTTIAKISVKNHHNGALHPKAHFQRELTVEDVLKAPIIAWPLGLYDCCPTTDGAAAAIIASAEVAKKLTDDPIYIKGLGLSVDPLMPMFRPGFDYLGFEANRAAAKQAYEQAGIADPRKELSLAEVHDCFTITELIIYEDLGFCKKGEAKEHIDSGAFSLEGDLPVNTDGGLKSFGHPIGASGLRMCYEVYNQLKGRAGPRQLKDPELGLAHNLGGPPNVACIAILGH